MVNLTALTVEKIAENNSLRVVLRMENYLEVFWNDYTSFGSYFSVNTSYSSMQAYLVKEWTFKNGRVLTQNRLLATSRAGTYSPGQAVSVVFEYN